MGRYADFVNRFSATPFGRKVGAAVAARLDPKIYKLTRGRFTMAGKPTLPQINLTTTGRKSGQPRTVQLAYFADGDDLLVVASNFGQDHHPAWRHNLDADPNAMVQLGRDEFPVRATPLTDAEKAAKWSSIEEVVPQMKTYKTTTDRNIRVFRLSRR